MRDTKRIGSVLEANAEYTGGGIYRYTAKINADGVTRWLLGSSDWDVIYLMDEDPDSTEDSWYNEWSDAHTVRILADDYYYTALNDMLTWIIENRPSGNYAVGEIKEILEDELSFRDGYVDDEDEDTSKDRKVTMAEFVKIYNAALTLMFNDIGGADNVIYGNDLTIHWNGIYCNCGDGASVYNNIIAGIEGVISEEGEV